MALHQCQAIMCIAGGVARKCCIYRNEHLAQAHVAGVMAGQQKYYAYVARREKYNMWANRVR